MIVLVNPPHAKACEPTPGPLVLARHLRRAGVEVRLVDANLEVQEALLSSESLGAATAALALAGTPEAWITSGRRVSRRVEEAKASLRDPLACSDARRYAAAAGTVSEAFRLLSRARGARLSVSDLECPGLSPLSTGDLARSAREPAAVSVAPELERSVAGILAGSPAWVGVSCTYLSQAIPSFALAGLLRKAGYEGSLVLGGGLPSSWAARLSPASEFFRVWDAVVTGPGELALEALVRGEARGPGLLAPRLGAWNPPTKTATVCFESDASGLPWGRYLSPGPILPLATSRGCYWRRCAFCPETAQDSSSFQAADVGSLAETILRARDTHGFRHVHLTDDAIPPRTLRRLAQELRGHGISWYGFARLERPLLDPSFAEALAAGGCSMLQLGVETSSQRLLDLLGKGTRIQEAEAILENLTSAGIRTYVYLLFGAPSETEAEALDTVEWAARNRDRITFLNLALLNLPRGSPLEQEPERYGLASLREGAGGKDLSLYRGYAGANARDRRHDRRVLAHARAHPALRPILARTPPGFTSNHAAFVAIS